MEKLDEFVELVATLEKVVWSVCRFVVITYIALLSTGRASRQLALAYFSKKNALIPEEN